MSVSRTLEFTYDLLSRPSVTPEDEGCQDYISSVLSPLGFNAEQMDFKDVKNLWLRKGNHSPVFVFAGHTDVVPVGDLSKWESDPFVPTEKDGMIYARGAADMKGSIACFMAASEQFVKDYPDHKGSIAMLITSDEEADAINGTVKVVEVLEKRNEKMDYCLVGEPSSSKIVGDTIKNGRRGSMIGRYTFHGVQGHVAYPQLAENPVHTILPFLQEMVGTVWDDGNEFFPATSFQISNINSGTGATNVIPGECHMMSSFRFCTESTPESLQKRVQEMMDKHGVKADVEWEISGLPFLTGRGKFVDAAAQAVKQVMGFESELSTAGGTSDGRFIAPTGTQVMELGPVNATIHKVNECVKKADLEKLTDIYYQVLKNMLLD